MRYPISLTSRMMILGSTLMPAILVGQTAQNSGTEPDRDTSTDDEVYYMSPFEVTAGSFNGYSTTETLAGTRLRTDLKDLATSISVVNNQFLKDTGATDNQSLLVYTTNTEVGGLKGNFYSSSNGANYNETAKLINPSANNRIRGLASADNTQNYFLSDSPWDGYNVDRVEMQRGPNSILFGVGSPAGIVNTVTKSANYKNAGEIETRVGSYGSIRGTVDVNRSIIDDVLAVRVIGLYDNTKYQQKPAFQRDQRIFGTVRWEPKLFGKESNTSIRANFEHGNVKANRPRQLPPIDNITPWFYTGSSNGIENLNKRIIDPLQTYDYYINNPKWKNANGLASQYPWLANGMLSGNGVSQNPAQYFDMNASTGSSTPILTREGYAIQTSKGIGSTGATDGGIGGLDNFFRNGVSSYSYYAAHTMAGGSYYSDRSLSDDSIYDFYNNLMDGDTKREWQKWNAESISISQTFLNNRIGFELASYYQEYEEGQESMLNAWTYSINVDVASYYLDGTANPNAGRAFVTGGPSGTNNFTDRFSNRGTAFVDLRSSDLFEESWLTRILGHHLISGLVSNDVRKSDNRSYLTYAYDPAYAAALGMDNNLTSGARGYSWLAYIGQNMQSRDSASGLNLSRIHGDINPGGVQQVKYFDATWTGAATGANSYGDSGYSYTRHDYTQGVTEFPGTITTTNATQSENPANYVGWTTKPFNVLSARDGDIDKLYSGIMKERNTVSSVGATLQSFMLDDCLVATYGYRKDRVKTLNGSAPLNSANEADPHYVLDDDSAESHWVSGISRTWGVVVHTPDFITRNLPMGMNLSLFYGQGSNFQASAPRADLMGYQIGNQTGKTKDYGFALSILDGRLTLKTTWYKTDLKNATLPADGSGGLGSAAWWFYGIPLNGISYALANLDSMHDPQYRQGGGNWPWATNVNWDSSYWTTDESGHVIPTQAARELVFSRVKAFFEYFPYDQHFCDAYGLNLNVDKIREAGKNGDVNDQNTWDAFYAGNPDYGINPVTGKYDTVDGIGSSDFSKHTKRTTSQTMVGYNQATATCDTTSEGIEWELTARITDNWNLLLNVSKTDAKTTAVSPSVVSAIQKMTDFLDTDAGLLTFWGTDNFRTTWLQNVLRPYQTLMAKIGRPADEIAPWRFNVVSTYSFTEGMLKGVSVGGGYRWEDRRILGYQYDAAADALDIDKPWKSGTDDHFDLWVGYTRQLNDDVNWRIQLNARNVFEDAHLVPIYIQPDGTTGYSRIAEGTSWFLTNTFTF